jgi:hypothetical protein
MTTRDICWEARTALSALRALVGLLLKMVTSLHGYEQGKVQPTSSQSSSLRRADGYTYGWVPGMTGRQLVSHFVNYLFKWLISYLFSLLMVGQLLLVGR